MEQTFEVFNIAPDTTVEIVLNGWPHGFGSDGGWVRDYADWLENIFKELKS